MHGEPIASVQNGLQAFVATLRQDPQALATVHLSVITFASSAQQVIPLTGLETWQLPQIDVGGYTALGEGLALLCDCREREVTINTCEQPGDWPPMVFILTNGKPTDKLDAAIKRFNHLTWGITVCCAAGPEADKALLKRIAPEHLEP